MKVNKKRIVGIKIDTSFIRAQSEIGLLWQRFYSRDIVKKVLNKKSEKIYVVYYNYESDYSGDYSVLIGYESYEDNELDSVEIVSGEYKRYHVKGELPRSVIEKWQEIWESDIQRAYTTDFEVYDLKGHDLGPDSEVGIYIAQK